MNLFNVTLNKMPAIQTIGMLAMVLLLTAFMPACSATHNQSTGSYMDDTGITTAVKTKLAADKMGTLTAVEVETVKGVVHLSGVVDNSSSKSRATDLAQQVEGVKRVDNNLQVQ